MGAADKVQHVKATVIYKHSTENAVLIAFDGEEHWVPRVCLSWTCDRKLEVLKRNEEFELAVEPWKADEIGLRY